MNIDKMSDREKSGMLANCVGWEIRLIGASSCVLDGGEYIKVDALQYPDLYTPHNMALAWRVHLWACNNRFGSNTWEYLRWFEASKIFEYEDAQRRWLDKAAKLAIEAGLVETPPQANERDKDET